MPFPCVPYRFLVDRLAFGTGSRSSGHRVGGRPVNLEWSSFRFVNRIRLGGSFQSLILLFVGAIRVWILLLLLRALGFAYRLLRPLLCPHLRPSLYFLADRSGCQQVTWKVCTPTSGCRGGHGFHSSYYPCLQRGDVLHDDFWNLLL